MLLKFARPTRPSVHTVLGFGTALLLAYDCTDRTDTRAQPLMSVRSSAISLYKRALRVAAKCPRPEQADFVRSAVRNGFSDNSKLRDSRAIIAAVKAGHAELDSMEVLHALFLQRLGGAASPDMVAAIADAQSIGGSQRATRNADNLAESPCSVQPSTEGPNSATADCATPPSGTSKVASLKTCPGQLQHGESRPAPSQAHSRVSPLVIAGPSGVGKGTLIQRLQARRGR